MALVWISGSMGNALMTYDMKFIEGDIYLNSMVSSSAELMACLVSGYIIGKYGLKVSLSITYLISISGMLGLLLTDTKDSA